MPKHEHRPRLAVLSPFVDKRHGTELCLAEQIERLSGAYEIHLYSSKVEDVDLSQITWHRVSMPPGPHLFRYVWWLFANRFSRRRDRQRGLAFELVYSPGVNCFDADLISVHELFGKMRRNMRDELRFRKNPMKAWPSLLHRRMYYRLAEKVENKVYKREDIQLIAVSQWIARDLKEVYGRSNLPSVIYHGIDAKKFSPARRLELRSVARAALGIAEGDFAVLLIGNDWKKKGLPCLLEAVGRLNNPRMQVLVVGKDISSAYDATIKRLNLVDRVRFLPSRLDVEFYYAAADVCAMPSLGEAFSLPPAEAMSCGLPVIVSRAAGVSEIMHHGEDGLILEDPVDANTLSEWLCRLSTDSDWRRKLGDAATITAGQYTWERNALQLEEILNTIVEQRRPA
jgi:glycosyltransferase involved in cell wall biosynthesis